MSSMRNVPKIEGNPKSLAKWYLSADVKCPCCTILFDILDHFPEFVDDIAKGGQKDVPVTCPRCHMGFYVDVELWRVKSGD